MSIRINGNPRITISLIGLVLAAANLNAAWVNLDKGAFQAIRVWAAPHVNKVYIEKSGEWRPWVSSDKGVTFTRLTITTIDNSQIGEVCNIYFDPGDTTDNTIYMAAIRGGGSGMFKTTDGGTTFKALPLSGVNGCDAIAVDWSDPQRKTVLACYPHGGGNLGLSTDGGITSTSIISRLQAVDATVTGTQAPWIIDSLNLLVGASNGLFHSTDGGATWKKVFTSQSPSQPPLVVKDSLYLYNLSWNNGLIRSTDHGTHWAALGMPWNTIDSWLLNTMAFLPDGRLVAIQGISQAMRDANVQTLQLLISTNFRTYTNFLAPFPVAGENLSEASTSIAFSKATTSLYAQGGYGKLSRWDLTPADLAGVQMPARMFNRRTMSPSVYRSFGVPDATRQNTSIKVFDLRGNEIDRSKYAGALRPAAGIVVVRNIIDRQ
jgi:hypothetical protein